MKRAWTVAAALALAVSAPLAAQQGPPGGAGMGMRGMMGPALDDLKTQLNLTPEQVPQVQALITKFQADTKAERETIMENMQAARDGSVTMESVRDENRAMVAKIRPVSEKLNQDIRALLTADQQKTFDAWLEQQRQRMGGRGRPPR